MWDFFNPVKVVFGEGELNNIDTYAKQCGFTKTLLVCDPFHYEANGIADRIRKLCGSRIVGVYYDIEPNPSKENVDACADLMRETGADSVIALGGGSSMDCAKAASVCAKLNCSAADFMYGKVAPTDMFPQISIPTTSGTGSEVTSGAVISNHETDDKIGVAGPAMYAKMAIVDPELTYTVPAKVTAASGIDVLAHALDSLSNKRSSTFTEPMAIRAAKMAFENLERVIADGNDKEARARMAEASVMIGYVVSHTGTSASHACSYFLTAKYHLSHGEACGFTLDGWIEYTVTVKPEFEEYARQIGFDSVKAMADRLREIKRNIGLKSTLAELGCVTDEDFEEVCERCMSPKLATNVGGITIEDVRRVFAARR